MINAVAKIETFQQLMTEIGYDWDSHYELTRLSDSEFVINKLYIGRERASYKTQNWELAPHLFKYVEMLYFIQELAKQEETK